MIEFFRQLLFRDLLLKLLSLALSILIWVTVSISIRRDVSEVPGSNTYSRTFYDQPVVVMSSAGDVSAFRVKPSEVDITVQGDPEALRNLQSRQIHALVDLTGIEGSTNENRRRIDVTTPPGFTHVSVVPADVELIRPPVVNTAPSTTSP
jgi:YbbR domain-containing protein